LIDAASATAEPLPANSTCAPQGAKIAELEQQLAAMTARAERAEQLQSVTMQVVNNASFTPVQAIAYLRAQFEVARHIAEGASPDAAVTIYLPALGKPVEVQDEETGEVRVFRSMSASTISRALKTVAEISGAFAVEEVKDPATGKTRLQMRNLHPTTRETMAAVATQTVYRDRSRGPGRGKPKDPRLATIEPCAD